MAEDWIKMRKGLRHDPKVIAIARCLHSRDDFHRTFVTSRDSSRDEQCDVTRNVTPQLVTSVTIRVTVCALLDVWSAANHALDDDGAVPYMELRDIDDIVEIAGFGEAMASVGWVIEKSDGGLEFPNFFEMNRTKKMRQSGTTKTAAQRAKEYRERQKAKLQSTTETPAAETEKPSRHVTRDKNRLDKNIIESPYPFSSADFSEWWTRWSAHRREIRKPLKPTTVTAQFAKFAEWGESKSIAAIKRSIENGWTGLFEPDEAGSAPTETHNLSFMNGGRQAAVKITAES